MPKRRKQQLKRKVDALPSTEQTAKDALDLRLDALTTPGLTVPCGNDGDGKWRDDSTGVAATAAGLRQNKRIKQPKMP